VPRGKEIDRKARKARKAAFARGHRQRTAVRGSFAAFALAGPKLIEFLSEGRAFAVNPASTC